MTKYRIIKKHYGTYDWWYLQFLDERPKFSLYAQKRWPWFSLCTRNYNQWRYVPIENTEKTIDRCTVDRGTCGGADVCKYMTSSEKSGIIWDILVRFTKTYPEIEKYFETKQFEQKVYYL